MQSQIKKITNRWSVAGVISKADEDIYEYGLELLLSTIINIIAILVSALFTGMMLESISMLAVVIPLQSCGGGYHAKTHLRCFLVMYIGWWGLVFLLPFIMPVTATVIVCLSVIVVIWLAPVPHINVNISEPRKMKMRKFSIIIAFSFSILSIALTYFVSEGIGVAMSSAIGVCALSMLLARLKFHIERYIVRRNDAV